jgi:diguanylate cyclase (GGDEF)-like protein
MRVSTRLIPLFLIPVTVVWIMTGSVVLSHRHMAEVAKGVDRGVVQLTDLVTLRDALQLQLTAASFEVRAAELGITTAVVSEFFGFDITGSAIPSRAPADRAITSLGSRSPVASGELHELYEGIDSGAVDPRRIVATLSHHLLVSDAAITRDLDQLSAKVDDRGLSVALDALRTTNGLVGVAARQGLLLSSVWFPTPGSTEEAEHAVLVEFAQDTRSYQAGTRALQGLGDTRVAAQLRRIEADVDVVAFDAAVGRTLRGIGYVSDGETVPPEVIATFRGYFNRGSALTQLLAAAAGVVRSEAEAVAGEESKTFNTWASLSAAICVGSLALGWATGRSISRPLRDLAVYAQAVNAGDLDARPSRRASTGPRETRVACRLFADLAVNLRLLDAKAIALAGCDFEAPVLGTPFPGRLGRSFESSVAVLSGSIVERDELQSHLAHQSSHDSLTGIRNRTSAMVGLQLALDRRGRSGTTMAVLFLDLNEFKSVNDRYGHAVGDAVLQNVAARLGSGLRATDFVARLGGDEFVIVAEDVRDVEGALALARRTVEAVGEPMYVERQAITIRVAVGIALADQRALDPMQLLSQADAAMYRAKRHERSGIEVYDAALEDEIVQRLEVETALAEELAKPDAGGLCLHYQPVLEVGTGALAGAEALIRWDRGDGFVAPDRFIPVAEASSLIIDVDRWVLAEAARQLVAWSSDAGLAGVPIAVNISGRHLLSGLLATHVREVIEDSGIDPSLLAIEITETVLLTDLVAAGEQLDAVHALGVKVAIDDFGTGYTSPGQLQFLPMDAIKIDRSFVSRVQDHRGNSVVRMIIDLAHAIDIGTVAEGVETSEELAALTALGADYVQGFLFSRALPPDQLSTWVAARTATVVLDLATAGSTGRA